MHEDCFMKLQDLIGCACVGDAIREAEYELIRLKHIKLQQVTRKPKETFEEKLKRIYDDVWDGGETSSLSPIDEINRDKLMGFIDTILER